MKYVVDTDIVIAYFRGNPGVVDKFLNIQSENIFISAMTKAELLIGPKNLKGKRAVNSLKIIEEFIGFITVLPFDSGCADVFAEISFSLKKSGSIIGDADIIIAATAIKNNSTLVTHNQKHFSRVKKLPCIDWFEL